MSPQFTLPKPRLSRNDYTDQQLTAIGSILSWYNSTELVYTLSGSAGTGKTTILRDIVANINGKIACTAPTHKAVSVASKSIGVEGKTIQKLLGLRPNVNLENFDINNPQFDPLGNTYLKDYKLVIIDECSMVNRSLHELIIRDSKEYGVKILYCGDPYQLPPVGEAYSMAFYNKNISNLTTIVRQDEGNPLIELLSIARDDVKSKKNNLLNAIYSKKDKANLYNGETDEGLIVTSTDHFTSLLYDRFGSHEFETNVDYCRYTAYTNESILVYNRQIRHLMFGDVDSTLIHDDLLVSYSTILDEFGSPIIVNSEDYIIDQISEYRNKYDIKGYLVKLKAITTGITTSYIFVVDHSDPDNVSRYIAIFNKYITDARGAKRGSHRVDAWERFYQFKNYNLLMTNLYTPSNTLIVSKDLDYGFGLTVHKTQGSTFNNIFINVKDIVFNKSGIPYSDTNLRNRLLYVALSRASKSAFILI